MTEPAMFNDNTTYTPARERALADAIMDLPRKLAEAKRKRDRGQAPEPRTQAPKIPRKPDAVERQNSRIRAAAILRNRGLSRGQAQKLDPTISPRIWTGAGYYLEQVART